MIENVLIKRVSAFVSLSFLFGMQVYAQNIEKAVTAADIIITPENPLRVKDSVLRAALIDFSTKELNRNDYDKIKAHPSAAVFPGAVKQGYSFIEKQVTVTHHKINDSLVPVVARLLYSNPWGNTIYSTGLYAVPGEYIEVKIPAALKGKNIHIQIGAHSDRLSAKEDWRRMPVLVKNQELTEEKTRLTSPFGGLIYITASPTADDFTANISIKHAIASPLYTLNETSPEQWQEQLKNNKAPWGELVANNVIITIPDSILQKVNDPQNTMKLWDLVLGGEMELAQIARPYYRKQRLLIDEHISAGFMHSGYPIMVHHSPVKRMLSADIIANPALLMQPSEGGANWGFFHEIGHNLQNTDWVFGGTTEVSCNFFSLYMFDRLMSGREGAHGNVKNTYTQNAIRKYFKEGVSYEKWKKDPFLGLMMFRQLQEGFGWESFKAFFRIYQQNARSYAKTAVEKETVDTTRPGRNRRFGNLMERLSDQQKIDRWVSTFSGVTGRDVSKFFETWGIPVSDTVKKELSVLKEWMPYNFPLEN